MKKTFILEDLDCANCAAKMERKIQKIDGVISASVDFMTTKFTLEADNDKWEAIVKEAEKIIHKIEPEVIIK